MKEIPLQGKYASGRAALIDDEDYEVVSAHRWRAWEKRRPNGTIDGPYGVTQVFRGGRRASLFMHTLITGWPRTDHRNGNGLDNQRSNLRPATAAQNNHNQRSHIGSSSQYKGVTWYSRYGKWMAQIKVAGKNRNLGYFESEEDAAAAYAAASLEAYGAYAYGARGMGGTAPCALGDSAAGAVHGEVPAGGDADAAAVPSAGQHFWAEVARAKAGLAKTRRDVREKRLAELIATVERLGDCCPPRWRRLAELRAASPEAPWAEIGAQCGMSENAAMKLASRMAAHLGGDPRKTAIAHRSACGGAS